MAFDPLSFIIGQQTAKSGGGSGGDYSDVHFVTFMSEDGTKELYKRAVVDGDDCADPVIRGLISEPTKESTAQYNYTLVGWSASANGALDENILKAVTADKTVYANFAAVLRYYTVTYYDDDGTTVLKTESLAYGTMPSYKPTKDGYTFTGWTPALAKVTSDTSYMAQWLAKVDFNALTWAQIASYAQSGEAANVFDIGATKTFSYTNYQGTSYPCVARIVGFNHDNLANGSGKAGITLQLIGFQGTTAAFNSTGTNQAKQCRWNEAECRTTLRAFAETSRTFGLPSSMKTVIKTVTKKFYDHVNKTYGSCEDTVFLPSASELGYDSIWPEEGECYEAFAQGKTLNTAYDELICKLNSAAVNYWTRTRQSTSYIYRVTSAGKLEEDNQGNSSSTYPFGFICI